MEIFLPNTVPGWFARDPVILKRVGKVLLQLQTTSVKPDKIFIPEDCFKLLSFPGDQLSEVLSKSMAILYGSKLFLSPCLLECISFFDIHAEDLLCRRYPTLSEFGKLYQGQGFKFEAFSRRWR